MTSTEIRTARIFAENKAEILAAFHRLGARFPQPADGQQQDLNEDWERHHHAFHASLIAACGSPRLLEYRALLNCFIDRYRRLSIVNAIGARDIEGEHRALMQAVLARDATLAGELIGNHFVGTTRIILFGDPETRAEAPRLIEQMRKEINLARP